MITVQGIFEPSEPKVIDELMRHYSSCMHSAFNILLDQSIVLDDKHKLQKQFSLNARYVNDTVLEAQSLIDAQQALGRDPRKIIFGSKNLFLKLKKKHLSSRQRQEIKERYQEVRQGNLYSRGETSRKGNPNIRLEGSQLRINICNRKYTYGKLYSKHKKWKQLTQAKCYTVRITKRGGKYHAYFSFEEVLPEPTISFENGTIGIDLNASPANIAWAEVNHEGNYLNSGTIGTPQLFDCRADKRDWYVWKYARQIVDLATQKKKAVVIEDLHTGGVNRVTSNFCRRKLATAIEITCKRKGVGCKKVNPAYTSIIGCVKYSPIYNLSRHESAALVIARRGMKKIEKLPKSFACLVDEVSVNLGKKETKYTSFKKVYEVCKIAAFTVHSTGQKRCKPNWSVLKEFLLTREDGRLSKRLVPVLGSGTHP